MRKRTAKIDGIVPLAKKLMHQGAYIISKHAFLRGDERSFSVGDIQNVIDTGYHEKKKDEYKEEYNDWNYSIRGKTLDNESARVCLSFMEETHFIVITVIRLEG